LLNPDFSNSLRILLDKKSAFIKSVLFAGPSFFTLSISINKNFICVMFTSVPANLIFPYLFIIRFLGLIPNHIVVVFPNTSTTNCNCFALLTYKPLADIGILYFKENSFILSKLFILTSITASSLSLHQFQKSSKEKLLYIFSYLSLILYSYHFIYFNVLKLFNNF